MLRRVIAVAALALLVCAPAQAKKAPPSYPISFHAFALPAGGLTMASGGLTNVSYTDPFGYGTREYQASAWTSPWFATGFGFTELVASWNADTPAGTWVQIEVHATSALDGHVTKWYVLGNWAYGDADFHRTSVGLQGDTDGTVSIDTFFADKKQTMTSYQLRVTLYRAVGSNATPTVTRVGAVASNPESPYVPSTTTMTGTVELPVPPYSQELHRGEYPQYDNGGEAWCSPTSTSMVVAYWGRGPAPSDYGYVLSDYPFTTDPVVDYAARYVYDYHYQGAGNWPFNTAYAAHFGLESEVTQLHSLAEAEQFIKARIPLVISIAFGSGKLDGFFFKSTNGHLMVISGFEADGDVIANDPASPDDPSVRHVYDRTQFEDAWMNASGGIAYVIHPASVALPPSPLGNW